MAYYHAHLTLKEMHNLTIPKGWKETKIILIGDNVQTDVMLTKHYVTGHKGITSVEDILADIKELDCYKDLIRIKVEQTSDFTLPINKVNYTEVHLKCKEDTQLNNNNWVRSRNPSEYIDDTPLFFFNRRIYTAESHQAALDLIESELKDIEYIEKKVEQVVFDSNVKHDAWWA